MRRSSSSGNGLGVQDPTAAAAGVSITGSICSALEVDCAAGWFVTGCCEGGLAHEEGAACPTPLHAPLQLAAAISLEGRGERDDARPGEAMGETDT